jgi:hypothetical protein
VRAEVPHSLRPDFHFEGDPVFFRDGEDHGVEALVLVFLGGGRFGFGDGPGAFGGNAAEGDLALLFGEGDGVSLDLGLGVGEGAPDDIAGGSGDFILDAGGAGGGVEAGAADDFGSGTGVGVGEVEARGERIACDGRGNDRAGLGFGVLELATDFEGVVRAVLEAGRL